MILINKGKYIDNDLMPPLLLPEFRKFKHKETH